ncbi:NRDE family protein [Salibacterium aidingense]|uniref:NRDE family protein n=1 Tax=Salibacterium aidingense TaxID=384933 RepID=UPI003BBBACEE
MCLIVIAYNAHPDYPLIVAANRDEFYDRPALPLHRWPGSPVIAGKDMNKGGTWMGATKSGRFAAITNVRDPGETTAEKSRGEIVKGFLESENKENFLERLNNRQLEFGGYNFIGGDTGSLLYATNQEEKVQTTLGNGIYGISNAYLDTPWPKVVKTKSRLRHLLNHKADKLSPETLFDILSDEKEADDDTLPDTGVGYSLEKKLSPAFIKMSGYGTRSQTVLFISNKNEGTMEEKTYLENGRLKEHTTLNWNLENG